MKKILTVLLCFLMLLFPVGCANNLDCQSLISLPERWEDGTCGNMHNVQYNVYYPSEKAYAIYAEVDIKKYTYNNQRRNQYKLVYCFG